MICLKPCLSLEGVRRNLLTFKLCLVFLQTSRYDITCIISAAHSFVKSLVGIACFLKHLLEFLFNDSSTSGESEMGTSFWLILFQKTWDESIKFWALSVLKVSPQGKYHVKQWGCDEKWWCRTSMNPAANPVAVSLFKKCLDLHTPFIGANIQWRKMIKHPQCWAFIYLRGASQSLTAAFCQS